MRILQVNNVHRTKGGSDFMAEMTVDILKSRGEDVVLLSRDSSSVFGGFFGRLKAFGCGIYSAPGVRVVAEALRTYKPDVVHVHEIYPFFSPWALKVFSAAGVPVVMTCHDFRVICPIGLLYCKNKLCDSCIRYSEIACMFLNCRNNISESAAYALRGFVARKFRLFLDNVTTFIALTDFAKKKFVSYGIPPSKIAIVPNPALPPRKAYRNPPGGYFAFIGRMAKEKGLMTFVEAARMTDLPVRIAGDHRPVAEMLEDLPPNVKLAGLLGRDAVPGFYRDAYCVVVPSTWYEMFPLVLLEAMAHGRAVIASCIGAMADIVHDGETGLLFEAGNAADLAEKMQRLWADPGLCVRMGLNGRDRAVREYSDDMYYQRLMGVYRRAHAAD